jgi:hypothetical protein
MGNFNNESGGSVGGNGKTETKNETSSNEHANWKEQVFG